MNKHEFTLLSGVSCVVREMTVQDEENFTKRKKGENALFRLNQLLSDCIISVGSITFSSISEKERLEFVRQMLSRDRELVLMQIQQVSTDFEPFEFVAQKGQQAVSVDIQSLINNAKPYGKELLKGEKNTFTTTPANFSEYSDVQREFQLDILEERVRFFLLSGADEEVLAAKSINELNVNSRVMARRPAKLITKNKDGQQIDPQWVSLNLKTLSRRDLALLRNAMSTVEATLQTTVFDSEEKEHSIFTPDFFILGGMI